MLTRFCPTYWSRRFSNERTDRMNAAQILLPEEEQQYRQAGIRPKEAIPYLLEKPTDSWQVVLIADEAQQKIRVEGYGKDLSQPLIVKEIPCCQF